MPYEKCPVDDKILAEYSLGAGRTRLSPEECARVEAHLKTCAQCRKDLEAYVQVANNPNVRVYNPDVDEKLIVGTQNVMARVRAMLNVQNREAARVDVARRWRPWVLVMLAAAVALTSLVFLLFDPQSEPVPPQVVVVREPSPGLIAANLTEEENAIAEADAERANDAMRELNESIAVLAPAEILTQLAEAEQALRKESIVYRSVALSKLTMFHEELLSRVRETEEEASVSLALARSYLAAGLQSEWLRTFRHYATIKGDQAWQAAVDGGDMTDDQSELVGWNASATAYFDEVKRLHDLKGYGVSIRLNEQLTGRYPRTAKAWEGLVVAARCYFANGQPTEAINCYRKIMDECPDELFAREGARALLRLYLYADQLDNAISQARRARERFQDNEFKAFSLTMEGLAHERKGEPHYPAAIRVFREAYQSKTGSPYAEQANERLADLRAALLREMNLNMP